MDHESLRIIEELYRAFRERDYDAFRGLCAPEVEWIQNEGFPGGGRHVGAEAIISGVFQAFQGRWETFGFQLDSMFPCHAAAGRHAVLVIGHYQATARATGRAVRAAAAHLYELENGKLVRYRQFTDTKPLWDALG